MSYLVLQSDCGAGRCLWRCVWTGFDLVNARHWATHFARLHEMPTIVVEMRSTDADMAVPTVVLKADQFGRERQPDEVSE